MSNHKNGRSLLFRTSAGVGMALTLLTSACAAPEDASDESPVLESSEQALSKRYDGATLLRGIFFGRGPVAAALPEVWGKAPLTQEAAAEAFRSGMRDLDRSDASKRGDKAILEIIASKRSKRSAAADEAAKVAITLLAKKDPGFLQHFERSMYSGDPVVVSGAIEEAGKALAEILEVEIVRDLGRYGAEWWVNQNFAINENAAVNVNVAVNVDTAYNVTQFWSLELDRLSQLRNEMMVATLTQRFAY